jgi:hypothetical protein
MAWRVAKSLETLRNQVNEMAPGRDTSSDGTIGDTAHQGRKSDHNPDANGVVTAMDITHDPAHGVNAGELAEMLRLSQDARIKYVISNRRIFSSKNTPWQWREYSGANAHTKHVHVSVIDEPALYDDTRPWPIDKVARTLPPVEGPIAKCGNITATKFGGRGDPNRSAYDEHFISDQEFGVALPFHFKVKPRPKVKVTNPSTGASVVCDIVDVGPWNTDDPYWETGQRPQAESGTDRSGRKTNLAGIDLTPAAARAVGIDGKGKVDWEFSGASQVENGGIIMPANNIGNVLQQLAVLIQAMQKPQPADGQPAPVQGQMQPADLQKIFDAINALIGANGSTLGQTIGDLLNGKKTALGVFGALATQLLSQLAMTGAPAAGAAGAAGAGTAIGNLLLALTPAAGLSGFAMPIFLAIAAWGVLGKLEKWAQSTTPPPQK